MKRIFINLWGIFLILFSFYSLYGEINYLHYLNDIDPPVPTIIGLFSYIFSYICMFLAGIALLTNKYSAPILYWVSIIFFIFPYFINNGDTFLVVSPIDLFNNRYIYLVVNILAATTISIIQKKFKSSF